MESREKSATPIATTPWNKGKLIGAKPPLRPKHVWSIRTKLQVEERIRDLALFNAAIDSKLRGCDVVALKVEDVAPNGYAFGYSPGLLPAALTYASIALPGLLRQFETDGLPCLLLLPSLLLTHSCAFKQRSIGSATQALSRPGTRSSAASPPAARAPQAAREQPRHRAA